MASYEDIIMSMGPTVWDSMPDLSLVRELWLTEPYSRETLGAGADTGTAPPANAVEAYHELAIDLLSC